MRRRRSSAAPRSPGTDSVMTIGGLRSQACPRLIREWLPVHRTHPAPGDERSGGLSVLPSLDLSPITLRL